MPNGGLIPLSSERELWHGVVSLQPSVFPLLAMDIEGGGGFTETTSQSYCSKLQDAFVGVCIGFLLFSAPLGCWHGMKVEL